MGHQSYPSETDGTGCLGLERDLLRPFRAWTHWASPLGRAGVGALYAGLICITWAYAEKVRTRFLSLRQQMFDGLFYKSRLPKRIPNQSAILFAWAY